MLLQYTTEKGEKNANASTIYNWKKKNEMWMLLHSTTEKRRMKYKYFYNLQLKNEKRNAIASTIYNWRTKNEMWMLLQSTTGKRNMKFKCF